MLSLMDCDRTAPLLLSIFRHIGDAMADGVVRAADVELHAVHDRRVRVARAQPEQRLHDFAAPRAHQAVDAQNLATPHAQRDIGEFRSRATVLRRAAPPAPMPARGFGNTWSIARPTIRLTS